MMTMEAIYLEYKGKVIGYLSHRLKYPDVAEDLCSDVFVKVAAGLERFDPEKSSISTWIYTITRNTLYDYFRKYREHSELDESLTDSEDFTESLCNEAALGTLADALKGLPRRDREIIIRHYYKNESLKEISARLGYSYSYMKALHQDALQKIKVYIMPAYH